MILKSTYFFQSLALGGGGILRYARTSWDGNYQTVLIQLIRNQNGWGIERYHIGLYGTLYKSGTFKTRAKIGRIWLCDHTSGEGGSMT